MLIGSGPPLISKRETGPNVGGPGILHGFLGPNPKEARVCGLFAELGLVGGPNYFFELKAVHGAFK